MAGFAERTIVACSAPIALSALVVCARSQVRPPVPQVRPPVRWAGETKCAYSQVRPPVSQVRPPIAQICGNKSACSQVRPPFTQGEAAYSAKEQQTALKQAACVPG